MPEMREGIPKGETYNFHGDDARNVEIKELEGRVAFITVLSRGVRRDGICINGRFVYTSQHKSLTAGHTKTEENVGNRGRLDARFPPKCTQGDVGGKCFRPNITVAKFKSVSSRDCIYQMEF